METLTAMFHLPEKKVAEELGVCLTSLKKAARRFGIARWPYRKLRSLKRAVEKVGEDKSSLSSIASFLPTLSCSAELQLHSSPADPLCAQRRPCASPQEKEAVDFGEERLTCSLDGCVLTISNWSMHWTAGSLKHLLLAPLGGSDITFCDSGAKAHLHFTTTIAAQQARRVCDAASAMVIASSSSEESGSLPTFEAAGASCGEATSCGTSPGCTAATTAGRCRAHHDEADDLLDVVHSASLHHSGVASSGTPRFLSPPCSLSISIEGAFIDSGMMAASSRGWSCLASC